MRPRMLDLFCGEGGAGRGYSRAGWDVFGVDNDPARLRSYPLPHVEGDALAYLAEHGHEYDAIHASPPCQGYSRGTVALPDRLDRYDRLIAATRDLLNESGRPWVIENVMGARSELRSPFMLCGRMFRLTATDDDGTTPRPRPSPAVRDLSGHHPAPHAAAAPVARPGATGGRRVRRSKARQEGGARGSEGRLCASEHRRTQATHRRRLDERDGAVPEHPAHLHRVHRPPASRRDGGRSMTIDSLDIAYRNPRVDWNGLFRYMAGIIYNRITELHDAVKADVEVPDGA